MQFVKYTHVERWGTAEVDGIDVGRCYVFPKLDGANASAWWGPTPRSEIHALQCASRNQHLDGGGLQGFYDWAQAHEGLREFLMRHPLMRVFGEWLVPHTFKAYREDAWRQFYPFDVMDHSGDEPRYLHYDEYAELLLEAGLPVVQPLVVIKDPSEADLRRYVEQNTYLVQDGAGLGEGVVVKNYEFTNRFGRPCFAKLVRNEFKEENRREFGVPDQNGRVQVEGQIAEEYVTAAFVAKERAKVERALIDEHDFGLEDQSLPHQMARRQEFVRSAECRRRLIPRLLETCYHELVREEAYNFVKKYKDPTVDFKRLRRHAIVLVKRFAADLF